MRLERRDEQRFIGPQTVDELHAYAGEMGWFIAERAGEQEGVFEAIIGKSVILKKRTADVDAVLAIYFKEFSDLFLGHGRTREMAIRRALSKWKNGMKKNNERQPNSGGKVLLFAGKSG